MHTTYVQTQRTLFCLFVLWLHNKPPPCSPISKVIFTPGATFFKPRVIFTALRGECVRYTFKGAAARSKRSDWLRPASHSMNTRGAKKNNSGMKQAGGWGVGKASQTAHLVKNYDGQKPTSTGGWCAAWYPPCSSRWILSWPPRQRHQRPGRTCRSSCPAGTWRQCRGWEHPWKEKDNSGKCQQRIKDLKNNKKNKSEIKL